MPPDVMKPAAVGGPWNRAAVAPTTSDWISPRLGKARVFSAFSCRNISAAASRDLVDFGTAVVDHAEGAAVLPARVTCALGLQVREHLGGRQAAFGETHGRGC